MNKPPNRSLSAWTFRAVTAAAETEQLEYLLLSLSIRRQRSVIPSDDCSRPWSGALRPCAPSSTSPAPRPPSSISPVTAAA